jgi:hypothetical protein
MMREDSPVVEVETRVEASRETVFSYFTDPEITLEEDGRATVVRLRHTGLPSDDSRALHRDGWTHYLSRLSVTGTGGTPGPDPLDRS